MNQSNGNGNSNESELAQAILNWAGHQDFTKRGSRRCRNRVNTLLAYKPDLTGVSDVQPAVAELYRRMRHSHKSDDRGMSYRRRDCLIELLALGLDPTVADVAGDTLLHQLCRHGAPMADIRQLLSFFKDDGINMQNHTGETPLLAHVRSSAPVQGVVRLLLANGASPDIADNDDVTPMDALQVKSTRHADADKLADILEKYRKTVQVQSVGKAELAR